MTINALNSGAKVWMADFADATSPTWDNVVMGQVGLRDALNGTINFTAPDDKRYEVGPELPTIMVRPRGWRLPESHLRTGGAPGLGVAVRPRHVPVSTADSGRSTAAAGRTSTCPKWSRTWRPGCGMTCSCPRRSGWASRAGPPSRGADREDHRGAGIWKSCPWPRSETARSWSSV